MQKNNLQYTKRRLTILFTVAIFCIVFILGLLFFSFRYANELRQNKNIFVSSTHKLLQDFSQREDILDFLNIVWWKEKFDDDFVWGRWVVQRWPQERFMSYIIISQDNEIVEKTIREDIDFSLLMDRKSGVIYHDDGVFIRKENIEWLFTDATVIFYKRNNYSFSIFATDVGIFTVFALLFSVVFYTLSYKFVGRTLKPVEENIKDMWDFIHNAGHELKTPLAVMHGNMQIMQAEKSFDAGLIKNGIREIDRMNKLIEGLIEISEVGKSTQKSHYALATEVAIICREFLPVAKEKSIKIDNMVKGKFLVYCNREELSIVLTNLLQNAIRYNKKKGKVTISLEGNVLSFHDTGIGMSEEEIIKIFDRFYQGSMVRSGEWFGIGLSLVKKIVDANGWKIDVESIQWEWTTFKLIF